MSLFLAWNQYCIRLINIERYKRFKISLKTSSFFLTTFENYELQLIFFEVLNVEQFKNCFSEDVRIIRSYVLVSCIRWFNSLQPVVAFLYPLKTSENLSGGIKKQHWAVMG